MTKTLYSEKFEEWCQFRFQSSAKSRSCLSNCSMSGLDFDRGRVRQGKPVRSLDGSSLWNRKKRHLLCEKDWETFKAKKSTNESEIFITGWESSWFDCFISYCSMWICRHEINFIFIIFFRLREMCCQKFQWTRLRWLISVCFEISGIQHNFNRIFFSMMTNRLRNVFANFGFS